MNDFLALALPSPWLAGRLPLSVLVSMHPVVVFPSRRSFSDADDLRRANKPSIGFVAMTRTQPLYSKRADCL